MLDGAVKVSIVIPTYNERDNILYLLGGLRNVLEGSWAYEAIVVDDNSPDGTAELVQRLASNDPHIRLVQRPGKLGLGSAVVDGFRRAQGQYWVMMDADLSHRPVDLPQLLEALSQADIAIGSRYTRGGRLVNWPFYRKLVSRRAAALGRLLLRLNVRDLTSGYAAFRREAVEPLLPVLDPKGFKLLPEILVKNPTARVVEVPIVFVNRSQGRSKFSAGEVVAFLRLCLSLRRLQARSSAV